MNDLKVTMNEYLPLRDVVFNTLRQAILKGELEPGERLMEIQLAERLGVSRTPIREAIRKLELEGLVIMVPRKGAEVAKITEKDLNDVLEVRCALEELAVELACNKITEEQIEQLKITLEQFKNVIRNKDLTEIAEMDEKFHMLIFEATGNGRLIQLLNNLREQMYRYRVEYLKDQAVYEKLVEEHDMIAKNILESNVELAKKNIKDHIINQAVSISKSISGVEEE
ncbi:GntR family transcriptional regulator [Anaerosporobacter faecicola]|uniref:GntR family transcriptional regulator n=1 Tax=Anaerosporobacter faecicola TaxID=2718714 RepID=UPI00143C6B7D|nr:GntR family transcriptional regulator [Anaerosporobacter faecicola]